MSKGAAQSRGSLVAAALACAWRREPPATSISEDELEQVAPLLNVSGAGALAWWKFRHTPHGACDAAQGFRQSYRLQTLHAAAREAELGSLFALLEAAGVEAVLVKGWAAGRAYAEQGLRPPGDIDLCVRPGREHRKAREVLASPEGGRFWVDLHAGCGDLGGDPEELYGRARVFEVEGARVRVPCEEDHLRLLCFHLLKHGAWRPLWLCDVAAALESRGEGFDWRRLLGRSRREANWVMCTLGLAHVLLGANVEGTPAARLPRWLAPAVLARWARPYATEQAPLKHHAPMRRYLRRPRGLIKDLRNRWPGPVEATVAAGGRFGRLPRWPFQLAHCFTRAARFVAGKGDAAAD